MKARRKSDGKIIEVEEAVYNMKTEESCHKCLSDGHHYPASELDFNLDAEETVIQGWMARDKNGDLFMYSTKPEWYGLTGMWYGERALITPSNDLFPDLTWNDDLQEVEIIIKRKKNGH